MTAAGEFYPRGHTGAGFAGGFIGGDLAETLGGAAGAVGTAGGYVAGTRAHDAASGLPEQMIVGVSGTMVYGFSGNGATSRSRLPRAARRHRGEGAPARQRARARVDRERERPRIDLEGNRLPITH